jgi:hypothetical protein
MKRRSGSHSSAALRPASPSRLSTSSTSSASKSASPTALTSAGSGGALSTRNAAGAIDPIATGLFLVCCMPCGLVWFGVVWCGVWVHHLILCISLLPYFIGSLLRTSHIRTLEVLSDFEKRNDELSAANRQLQARVQALAVQGKADLTQSLQSELQVARKQVLALQTELAAQQSKVCAV